MSPELRRFFVGLALGLALTAVHLRAEAAQPKPGCENMKCSWRLWSHYKEKGCEPLYDSAASCCPSRFKCPPRSTIGTGCSYGGRVFAVGSTVDHSDSCRMCRCQGGEYSHTGRPHIVCAHGECPELFGINRPNPLCRLLYSENMCCSTKTVCPPSKELSNPVCRWGNRSYLAGERMYFEDDACASCLCGTGFSGPRGPGCRRIDFCYLERQTELDDGCIPVYHSDTCCPIDWICPGQEVPQTLPGAESKRKGGCKFADRHYPLGSSLATHLSCTNCTCTTPPEFTCEQRPCNS